MKIGEIIFDLTKNHTILYLILREPARIFFGLPKIPRIAKEQSYFPEKKRKSYLTRLFENYLWLLKNRESNAFYNLYGFDIKHSSTEAYCNYLHFMLSRNKNNSSKSVHSQIVLLRDKYLFFQYMNGIGQNVPRVFGIINNGNVYDEKMHCSDELLKDKYDYFIKDIDGECASCVLHIKDYEDYLKKKKIIDKGKFIIQQKVVQSREMNVINPLAINTLRVVTINKNGEPYVLSALLRVGTQETGNVDNWAKGGLAIGIKETGYLKKYGFYKPGHGGKTNVHPDTNIEFEKFKIPLYQEALNAACEAHRHFYGIRSIGWDIAITEDGPDFIEGNDNWEISLMQACNKGLKKEWNTAMN
ncbi:sugar-transfer associated ATP-grasp domain-containing protein [uncultured Robinsoniella sp.]|uniref:sugar-transfer associated ATP-grasp domain-containing protein n=1 Tax=uncultured Robinsoniella sp. TaxID=904190 RepID=UPI00374F3C95